MSPEQNLKKLGIDLGSVSAPIANYVNAVRTGQTPAVTGEEGVASLEIAIRCLDTRAELSRAPERKGPRRVVSA